MLNRLSILNQETLNKTVDYLQLDRFLPKSPASLLQRLAVIAGVLMLSAMPLLLSPERLFLLLGLLLGVVVIVFFLYWPAIGLVALIPASLIISQSLSTGTETTLHAGLLLSVVLLGLWIFDMVSRQRRLWLLSSRPIKPLLLLTLTACVSFFVGQLPWFRLDPAPLPAQLGGLAIFILSTAVFLLVAHQLEEVDWLAWMTWSFLVLGALYMIGRVVPSIYDSTTGLFPNGVGNGSLFWTWLVALSASQAVFNRDLPIGWRLLLGCLTLLILYIAYVLTSHWKSGWIPPVASLAVLTLLYTRWFSLLLVLMGIFPALQLVGEVIASDLYSYDTRIDAWVIMLEIIKVNPILGLGPSNYYWYTPLFPIRGYIVQFNSHNQYVDIVAQTGLLGLFFFLWFLREVGQLGWELRTKVAEGFPKAYVYGALSGLAGTVVAAFLGDWVLPFTYNVGLAGFRVSILAWIFLGGLLVLEKIVRSETELETQNGGGVS